MLKTMHAFPDEVAESNAQFIQAWKAFVASLPGHEILDLPGVTVAWGGARLPVYNVLLLSSPVAGERDFQDRLQKVAGFLASKPQPGLFFLCEDWLPEELRPHAPLLCAEAGLHPAMPLTGMASPGLLDPVRPLPRLECRRVGDAATRTAISDVNCNAYGFPIELGRESIALPEAWTSDCFGHVAYVDGAPVATAATFPVDGRLYVGLVATLPGQQRRGYGEAVMRYSLEEAARATGLRRTTLHATAAGAPVYLRMGYHATAKFMGYLPAAPGYQDPAPAQTF